MELCAIVLPASTLDNHWSRKRVQFHCDNEVIFKTWSKASSSITSFGELAIYISLLQKPNLFLKLHTYLHPSSLHHYLYSTSKWSLFHWISTQFQASLLSWAVYDQNNYASHSFQIGATITAGLFYSLIQILGMTATLGTSDL